MIRWQELQQERNGIRQKALTCGVVLKSMLTWNIKDQKKGVWNIMSHYNFAQPKYNDTSSNFSAQQTARHLPLCKHSNQATSLLV